MGEEDYRIRNGIPEGKHVDQVGGHRIVIFMYRVDPGGAWCDRKGNCLGVGVPKVVDVAAVGNVGGVPDGVAAEEGKLAKGLFGGPAGKRGIQA